MWGRFRVVLHQEWLHMGASEKAALKSAHLLHSSPRLQCEENSKDEGLFPEENASPLCLRLTSALFEFNPN